MERTNYGFSGITSKIIKHNLKAVRQWITLTVYYCRTYDQEGSKAYVALTGAQLSTYGPLKNQYALVNLDGQVLVSELDGSNFENSNNINEFLDKYGIVPIPTGNHRTVENPAYSDAYNKWLEEYNEWSSTFPNKEDFTSQVPDTNNEIYIAVTRSGGCFGNGLSGRRCWAIWRKAAFR